MGKHETGASAALPAFIEFMKTALEGKPNQPFRVPRGIRLSTVDLYTGQPVLGVPGEKPIQEAFVSGGQIFIPGNGVDPATVGTQQDITKDAVGNPVAHPPAPPVSGTGALY